MGWQKQCVQDPHAAVLGQVRSIAGHILVERAFFQGRHEPQDVAPPFAVAGRMRVAVLIAEQVMLAVIRHPHQGRAFARQSAQQGKQPANRPVRAEAAVRQLPVVAHANADAAGQPGEKGGDPDCFPSEEKRSGQAAQVNHGDPDEHRDIQPPAPAAAGLAIDRAAGVDRLGFGRRTRFFGRVGNGRSGAGDQAGGGQFRIDCGFRFEIGCGHEGNSRRTWRAVGSNFRVSWGTDRNHSAAVCRDALLVLTSENLIPGRENVCHRQVGRM